MDDKHDAAAAADTSNDACDGPPVVLSSRRVTFSETNEFVDAPVPPSTCGYSNEDEQAPLLPGAPPKPTLWQRFSTQVRVLKKEVLALFYASHDPRTPLLCRVLPMLVLAYALSPIDLIPDFIPVLGMLDDLLLLPLMIWAAIAMMPKHVMADARVRAEEEPLLLHRNWGAALVVFLLWLALVEWLLHWLLVSFCVHPACGWLLHHEWVPLLVSGALLCLAFGAWARQRQQYELKQRMQWESSLLAHVEPV